MNKDSKLARIFTLTQANDTIVSAIYSSVEVSLPINSRKKLNIEEKLWVKALWDTGATNSAISDRMAKKFNFQTEYFADIYTALGLI
jgi:hypothetical protein